MPAIKGQGAQLNISTAAASATTVTAVTAASPVVVTATNTYVNGDIINLSGLVGPTNLNNRSFVASAVSGAAFTLKGEDGTANSAWVSGGSGFKQTMSLVGQVNSIAAFDGKAAEIDVTNLQSIAKEFSMGLQDEGNVTLGLFQLAGDVGQIAMRKARTYQTLSTFSIVLSDLTVTAFQGFVMQYTVDGIKPDGAVGNSVVIRVTNGRTFFA